MALLMVSVIGNAFGLSYWQDNRTRQRAAQNRNASEASRKQTAATTKRLPRQQESPASRPSPSSPTRTPYPTRCCTHDGQYSARSPSARATCIRVR